MFRSCDNLVAQFQVVLVAVDGVEAGDAVDGKWESQQGHAHAAARYGAMSRPAPSKEPPLDWRAQLLLPEPPAGTWFGRSGRVSGRRRMTVRRRSATGSYERPAAL